ncbi:MAG: HAMP domain-containing protein, partial [Thermomicrobiales bacterium]
MSHPSPAAYDANRVMVSRSIAAVAAAALMTLALGALGSELLTRPLRELRAQAGALAHGDFTPREPIPGGGEFADLSASLGVLASRFGEQVRDLEAAREAG